jgi:hypothetical protein
LLMAEGGELVFLCGGVEGFADFGDAEHLGYS